MGLPRYKCVECGVVGKANRFRSCKLNVPNPHPICNTCVVRHPLGAYKKRNAALRELGFDSYAAYLKSDMWKIIRDAIYVRDGYKCRKCGKPATNVHHQLYRVEVLAGARPDQLMSLCRECHHAAEITETNEKRPMKEVVKSMRPFMRHPDPKPPGVKPPKPVDPFPHPGVPEYPPGPFVVDEDIEDGVLVTRLRGCGGPEKLSGNR